MWELRSLSVHRSESTGLIREKLSLSVYEDFMIMLMAHVSKLYIYRLIYKKGLLLLLLETVSTAPLSFPIVNLNEVRDQPEPVPPALTPQKCQSFSRIVKDGSEHRTCSALLMLLLRES